MEMQINLSSDKDEVKVKFTTDVNEAEVIMTKEEFIKYIKGEDNT